MSHEGVLLVDKPEEWTSHDVCAFIRKRFRIRKVGHAGTLDPMATGLLVVLLGKATKLSNALSASEKEYDGVMELGIQTDSHDRQGKVLGTAEWEQISLEKIQQGFKDLTGDIVQVPPMVSALKYQGRRLYQLARQGITVPREGRPVHVHRFEMHRQEGPKIHFSVIVSKGTYVRTLVNDLGINLGSFATLDQLRRIRSGEFLIENAVTIEMLRSTSSEALTSSVIPICKLRLHANIP